MPPPWPSDLTRAERRALSTLRTPSRVQAWLNDLPYNTERHGETLRSFRGVVHTGTAHCLEAALFAAVVLNVHGHPPLVLSFESQDNLDHVIFAYRRHGSWGSIARSRDPGLHGRKPVYRTARDLARSYMDPYVDDHGRVLGFAVVNLDTALGEYDWRWSRRNVWKVEQALIDWPHQRLRSSDARYRRLLARYQAYRASHGGRKPVYYNRRGWTPIPKGF